MSNPRVPSEFSALQLQALHAHWIGANVLKHQFIATAIEEMNGISSKNDPLEQFVFAVGSRTAALMSYWYASLYVVVEGYRELDLHDPEIDQLIDSATVDKLRRFRNAVYHYQELWLSPKRLDFLQEESGPEWLGRLHSRLGSFLLDELKHRMRPALRSDYDEFELAIQNASTASAQHSTHFAEDLKRVIELIRKSFPTGGKAGSEQK